MPKFHYTALDRQGAKVKGEIAASDEANARRQVKSRGHYIVNMDLESEGRFRFLSFGSGKSATRISMKELVFFTRQLATLLRAGFTLDNALNAISEQITNPSFHKIILDIDKKVKEGYSLHESMANYPKIFREIYCSLVKAGEASGELESILLKLAEHQGEQMRLRNKVLATMMYPVIMVLVCTVVVMVLMIYVVPNVTSVLTDQGQDLPFSTNLLIASSDFMGNYWLLIVCLFFLAGWGIRHYYETESGKKRIDWLLLHLPLCGGLIRKMAIARFSSTFAVLLKSGVDILKSLHISKDTAGNAVIQTAIERGAANLVQGDNLSEPLRESGVFPPIVVRMIDSGQRSGNLELMLETIAQDYESEVENTLLGLTSILEPLIIVIMGGFVGFVVMSILMPMQSMMEGAY
jgi:general secretion pathway protein F